MTVNYFGSQLEKCLFYIKNSKVWTFVNLLAAQFRQNKNLYRDRLYPATVLATFRFKKNVRGMQPLKPIILYWNFTSGYFGAVHQHIQDFHHFLKGVITTIFF